MKQILPGVYQMTLTLAGFNPDSINVYLVRSDDGYLLVDTGWDTPLAVKSMENQLAESKIQFTDIKRIFLTHGHVDHLGMAWRFKTSHNAQVYLHRDEIELIKIRFKDRDNFIPMTDQFLSFHGVPASELTPPDFQIPAVPKLIDPDILLKGGEGIACGEYNFTVINTPGHTPGHVSLFEPQKRFLISGDILLPTIATNAAFHVQHVSNPLKQYLNTLTTLRKLEIDLVLPAHEYVFPNPGPRIDELIAKQLRRSREVLKQFQDGQTHTAYEVSQMLSWSPKTRTTRWPSLSSWDKRFALLLTIAHLEELYGDGKVSRFSLDGKIYYR
jgi:glyoxylase-like metal-dependent hydrolase (beta-lactamase superfamily II)